MSYDSPDVYHQPEHFGLTPIDTLDLDNEPYQFHYLCVWKHEDGRVFWAEDSGCSCPSPFENYRSLESLEHLKEIEPLKRRLKGREEETKQYKYRYFPPKQEVEDFLLAVELALGSQKG